MYQRTSGSSRQLIGFGLLSIVATAALPYLTPSPRGEVIPWTLNPPVRATETRFGGVCAAGATAQTEQPGASFWLGQEGAGYVPVSSWRYTELSDGSAHASCLFADRVDPARRWWFEAVFSGRRSDEARGASGESSWNRMRGSLRGLGVFEGALLELRESGRTVVERDGDGPGLRGSFVYETLAPPAGDADFSDEPGRGGFRARLGADDASFAARPAGGAVLSLPGIGGELVFVAGGRFEQRADGSARLSGVVARNDRRDVTFALEIAFAGSNTPGETRNRQTGGPVYELEREAYTQFDGPIDTRTWSYYESLSGTLTGFGEYAGAVVRLDRSERTFQVGVGANGVTKGYGAAGGVTATCVRQPGGAARLPQEARGELRLELGRALVQFSSPAAPSAEGRPGQPTCLELIGLGHDFVFTSGGQFVEQPDGSARLTGVMARRSWPETQLFVDLAFAQRCGATSASRELEFRPRKELHAAAYLGGGGSVDPGTWNSYGSLRGTLLGMGALAGARYEVSSEHSGFQVGVGANGRNLAHGGSGEFVATLAAESRGDVSAPERLLGELTLDFAREGRESVFAASYEPAREGARRDNALRIDGLGSDFVFASGGELVQRADGSASLSGVVARRSFPTQRFFLEAELDGRRDPTGLGHPPAGSPKLGQPSAALADAGGAAAPDSWSYYERCEGRLSGLDEFAGARVALHRAGPALQFGLGANNRNAHFGAAAWLAFEVVERPRAAANFPDELSSGVLTLDLSREFASRAEEAIAISAVDLPAGHALSLPGLATDLVFPGGGEFREYEDGSARLSGAVSRATDPSKSFDLLLDFKGRIDPGHGNYPPSGSPSLELPASAYVARGGMIDPRRWHYFQSIEGILVGTGDWAGSLLELEGRGPAAQVGYGANGRNFEQGASAVFDVKVIQAPRGADSWPREQLRGRLDIDLESMAGPTSAGL